ncbi:hypothetical protein CR513_16504, partial [Mucuna pruriens]
MSDITLRNDKELAQQQSINLHSKFSEIFDFKNSTDCDCTCTKLTKCPNCVEISNAINGPNHIMHLQPTRCYPKGRDMHDLGLGSWRPNLNVTHGIGTMPGLVMIQCKCDLGLLPLRVQCTPEA